MRISKRNNQRDHLDKHLTLVQEALDKKTNNRLVLFKLHCQRIWMNYTWRLKMWSILLARQMFGNLRANISCPVKSLQI